MAIFKMGSKSKGSKDERIAFVVPDRKSLLAASDAIAKVRIPNPPHLKTLEQAYKVGDSLLRILNPKSIKIVEQKGLSAEEAYRTNERTLDKLIADRNALAVVIEKMLQPVIRVVADLSARQHAMYDKMREQEAQINEMKAMMQSVSGHAPIIPPLPGGKKTFGGKMNEAADEVLRLYAEDMKLPPTQRQWKSERNASDRFFDSHILLNYPEANKDKLYWSVAKRKADGKTLMNLE